MNLGLLLLALRSLADVLFRSLLLLLRVLSCRGCLFGDGGLFEDGSVIANADFEGLRDGWNYG